jgi:hypothetical protein
LPPGVAHLAAAVRYQERNIAEGKCCRCPKPLDRNSVRFCTEHLAKERARMSQKKGLSDPGSREYLYAGILSGSPGRNPDNLTRLAMNREQKTRAVLAELGIAPESAAVTLKAAKEALLRSIPDAIDDAMTQAELFKAGAIPSRTIGQKALKELLVTQRIERIGKGISGDPFRYFVGAIPESRRKPPKNRICQNEAIQKILKGHE